MKKIMK